MSLSGTKVSIQREGGEEVDITPAFHAQEYNDAELETTQQIVANLLEGNWHGIMRSIAESEDSKGSVSFSLKLNHAVSPRQVKAKLSYALKTSDEAEEYVKDPQQEELPL